MLGKYQDSWTSKYRLETKYLDRRTKEIGTRKALGATAAIIRNQFLIEAVVICQLGGIAGIILTVGMAVDANVLIFERIREELKTEKSIVHAFDSGYSRAKITVLDANITTLIAAIILFAFGSGPVKGFAITLGIGIITTLFTAYFLARHLTSLVVLNTKNKEINI